MDLTDIERFFNENFFKKIPTGGRAQEVEKGSITTTEAEKSGGVRVGPEAKEQFMHGVPESGYEPTYRKQQQV